MTFTQETVAPATDRTFNPVALASTVGLATFLVALGLGIGAGWVSWLGVVWVASELGLRAGVYLGRRIGYEQGQDDMHRQISAW